jgi:hypothetical protein
VIEDNQTVELFTRKAARIRPLHAKATPRSTSIIDRSFSRFGIAFGGAMRSVVMSRSFGTTSSMRVPLTGLPEAAPATHVASTVKHVKTR